MVFSARDSALSGRWCTAAGPTRFPGAQFAKVSRTVLVHGGAGAVGHAAIQLATWSGATVLATVSSPEKAGLARKAGADHVIDYRTEDVAARVAQLAPAGVHHIVDVDLGANLAVDLAVLAHGGNINVYSCGDADCLPIPSREMLVKNVQLDFTFTYTTEPESKANALSDVHAAAADGALEVGAEHGLPVRRYALDQVAEAHRAVERGVPGKVLVDVPSE
ncbi:zinc-binding dehydrogenase [Amycolatopsis sp. DR6-1]|uniref:Zinc-binding dehydrogenase n=1 Tax=Amycolatopsis dendrobii TaxID=2760662 RepID=A0A7W3W6K1_9PSEU|nr:zinc-binding dehydrogenase [Amycolatopsis dendrobii]